MKVNNTKLIRFCIFMLPISTFRFSSLKAKFHDEVYKGNILYVYIINFEKIHIEVAVIIIFYMCKDELTRCLYSNVNCWNMDPVVKLT